MRLPPPDFDSADPLTSNLTPVLTEAGDLVQPPQTEEAVGILRGDKQPYQWNSYTQSWEKVK